MKTKKSTLLVGALVVVLIFAFYRYASKIFNPNRNEDVFDQPTATGPVVGKKELSAVATFKVPGGEDTVKFVVSVDDQGLVSEVRAQDVATNQSNKYLDEFTQGLIVVIKGKKMSELTAVDRIGKSSLTTDAFNGSIDQLKAQL